MKKLTFEEELQLNKELEFLIKDFVKVHGRKPKDVKEFEIFWNKMVKLSQTLNN